MSYGIVYCSICHHEVHQDGDKSVMRGWRHCDSKTPMCVGAEAQYPPAPWVFVGPRCGKDREPEPANRYLGRDATLDKTIKAMRGRIGRNDPCPCGSGLKFKKCCLNGTTPANPPGRIAFKPTRVQQDFLAMPSDRYIVDDFQEAD